MRLLSGNPGMYQHSVEHSTEGETAQHEPEHGEDTIARVKGTYTLSFGGVGDAGPVVIGNITLSLLCCCRPGEGSSEEVSLHC